MMTPQYDATSPPTCNGTNMIIDSTSTIWFDIKAVDEF